jgi:hypothetical protein
MTSDERNDAAHYLERFSSNPKAMDILRPRYSKRSSAVEIAMDYQIQTELLGTAKGAKHAVHKAWSKSEATVIDYNSDHGSVAKRRLERLVNSYLGRFGSWTDEDGEAHEICLDRRDVLQMISRHLRRNKKRHRKK